MVETVYVKAQTVVGDRTTATTTRSSSAPAIRWAHNFESGLQIVPGYRLSDRPRAEPGRATAVFLYLSFEHPFRSKQARTKGTGPAP